MSASKVRIFPGSYSPSWKWASCLAALLCVLAFALIWSGKQEMNFPFSSHQYHGSSHSCYCEQDNSVIAKTSQRSQQLEIRAWKIELRLGAIAPSTHQCEQL